MAIPTNKILYDTVKKDIYEKYPKHSLFRSALIVKKYKELGGEYRDKKQESKIDKWFNQKWVSVNDYYHDNKIVPCGSSDTQKKFQNYPLCRPLEIVKKLSDTQMKKMIEKGIKEFVIYDIATQDVTLDFDDTKGEVQALVYSPVGKTGFNIKGSCTR